MGDTNGGYADYSVPGAPSPLDGGPEISVDLPNLVDYYMKMMGLSTSVLGEFAKTVQNMTEFSRSGLMAQGKDGVSQLPEAAYMANLLDGRVDVFRQFFSDVETGLRSIGGAAVIVAEMYGTTDKDSAANIDAIDFAFGDLSKRPAHFRYGTQTSSDLAWQQQQASGANSMALSAPDNLAVSTVHPAPGVSVLTFADGSKRVVQTTSSKNPDAPFDTNTTTTYYAPPAAGKTQGAVISSQSKTVSHGYDGSTTTTLVDDNGDAKNGSTNTHTTTNNPDGSVTVSNSTETRTDGKTAVKTSDPVTVPAGDHSTDNAGQPGPMQSDENTLGMVPDRPYDIPPVGPSY